MDIIFCHFGTFFTLLTPNNPENQNFEKMKEAPGDVIILHNVHQKSQSYDVCFLRYGVRQTEVFVILDHFLPFYTISDPEY